MPAHAQQPARDPAPEPESPRSATKLRILKAAETAFADHGIDGVSLRQISERSGSKNVMAAQYHFGTRDNLIAEIIDHNTRSIDRIRQRLYGDANLDFDRMTTYQYVRLVIEPFVEFKNDDGERTFVRFLRALLHHDPYYTIWREHYAKAPFTDTIYHGLRKSLPAMPDAIWDMRKTAVGKLVVNSVSDFELSTLDEATFLADLIQIVTATLRAPVGRAEDLAHHLK